MAKKIVSLYIDDSYIRLLVMRGKEVLEWGELRLETGLVHGSEIVQEAEVAAKIKLLLKQFGIKNRRVVVGISGLFCLSRPAVLPKLPRTMLEEAIKREAKRLLPIPPEQCYLSWQIISEQADKINVFMVAVPRRIAESLYRALRQAGLKPYHLDIKPMSLARVSTEDTALILDLQQDELDIIILSKGVPQPIRTVSLPESTLSDEEKLDHIRSDVERTVKFYNSNNPDRQIDSHVPLLVSGQLAVNSQLSETLAGAFGLTTSPLQFPVRSPAGFKASQYIVNIGLALREMPDVKSSGSAVTNLNSLPPEYIDRPIRYTRVILVPAGVVLVSILALLFFLVQDASAHISSLRNEINNTNRLVALKTSLRKDLSDSITKLEQKAKQIDATITQFTTASGALLQDRMDTNADLGISTQVIPASVNMTSVSYAGQLMTIQGRSFKESAILDYARGLDASARFSSVVISAIKSTDNVTMDFTITLKGVR